MPGSFEPPRGVLDDKCRVVAVDREGVNLKPPCVRLCRYQTDGSPAFRGRRSECRLRLLGNTKKALMPRSSKRPLDERQPGIGEGIFEFVDGMQVLAHRQRHVLGGNPSVPLVQIVGLRTIAGRRRMRLRAMARPTSSVIGVDMGDVRAGGSRMHRPTSVASSGCSTLILMPLKPRSRYLGLLWLPRKIQIDPAGIGLHCRMRRRPSSRAAPRGPVSQVLQRDIDCRDGEGRMPPRAT